MGCKSILERHRRVVAALILMVGVNGPQVRVLLVQLAVKKKFHCRLHAIVQSSGIFHFSNDLLCSRLLVIERNDAITREITIATKAKC